MDMILGGLWGRGGGRGRSFSLLRQSAASAADQSSVVDCEATENKQVKLEMNHDHHLISIRMDTHR